jgi:O-antigen/teichoic acid export membrane protein
LTIVLAAVAFPPFALLWLFGARLLAVFLGPRWESAGHFVVILVPWLYALWMSSPANTVMIVLRRQAMLLRLQILLAVARITVFAVAYAFAASPEATLRGFVAVGALSAFGSIFATYFIVRRSDRALGASPSP